VSVTFIDFFSGIGGFHSGFEKAGMKCVGWCEFDKYAQKSYREIYDTKGLYFSEDVRKIRGWELPNATLWSFGFPCQDISVAGKQKGIGRGTRSGLFFEIMRLLDETEANKPEWIIAENVKNLLSIEGGWGFFKVTSEMAKRGYTVQWRVYNSKDYGVPQNRERVYIIGHLRERGGRELLPIARKSERTLKKVIDGPQGSRVYEPELSCTLSSQGGGMGARTGLYKFVDLSKGNPKITENARCLISRYNSGLSNRKGESSGVIAVLTPDRIKKRQNGRRFKEPDEPMFTLTGQDRHGVMIKNATKAGALLAMPGDGVDLSYPSMNTRRGRVQKESCNTITAQGQLGVLMESYPMVRIRKLTPKECWRLQGFTDEQFEKAAAVNSNSQLYKQAGNAVTVNVVEEIGRHIMKLIEEDRGVK
jgi:DNA (cytosine-5)-methyltransferase 1